MKDINLSPYIEDTKENLTKVVSKFSEAGKEFEDFLTFLKTDIAQKIVLLIGGDQISGSLSPFMHTYSSYKNDNPFLYTLFKMTKENSDLKEIFEYIRTNENILGANVTMPYKIEIFQILSDLGLLDESAKLVGAVNTIAKQNGEVSGYNTDMYGILEPIKEKLGLKLQSVKKGYVLGAGGAARAAIAGLLKLGIKDITIFNRNDENMINLVNHFNSKEVREILKGCFSLKIVEYDIQYDDKSSISEHIDNNGILINTLPFGFKSHFSKYPIREGEFDKVFDKIELYFDVVYDMNYDCTPMIGYIKENYQDIAICDGIDMVVEQAKKGFKMWSNGNVIDGEKIKKIFRGK
ncbi:MAG: hypothetical protein WC850_02765 [Candidatus Gracilibacteria bacterium]